MDKPLSCDTSVVLGSLTFDGSVIFAKNSDRPPNECQPLHHSSRRQHPVGATVKCQYLEIPQVAETWEVIGSRPYWLWGFEIGVNEWGVTIGNEAVFTLEPFEERALIGMDLLRLGLERAQDADAAVRIIGELVERYGQGGSCYATGDSSYHNSFIIADPARAWVLETAGRHWVARRVENRASISNLLTIGDEWDAGSSGVIAHAQQQGLVDGEANFARAYQDTTNDPLPGACRLERAQTVLRGYGNPVTIAEMMALLRDHSENSLPTGAEPVPTLCMHANPALLAETAASMVVHIRPNRPQLLATTCWTAFGSPCLSVFRPVYPHAVGLPAHLDVGTDAFNPASPWWVFERMQRMVARTPSLAPQVRIAFTALEQTFIHEAAEAEATASCHLDRGETDAAVSVLQTLVASTTARAVALAETITRDLSAQADAIPSPEITQFWDGLEREAGVGL
ncbi:MAG: C69 family dipeptidase [Thermomicrobiales bacterium]